MEIAVLGTGSYLPERVVDNDEVGRAAGVDDEWIVSKTGIRQRRWVAEEQATSDLAIEAARAALDSAGVVAEDIAFVVVATSSPDHPQPPTAVYVQDAVGASGAAAFDMNAVCSGFVFAVAVVARMLAGGGGYALVVGADIYSHILNPEDRRTVALFGDGAGAVMLGPAGGVGHEEGRAVKEFVLEELPPLVAAFLDEAGVDPADVDHFVPHQANRLMLAELFPRLGLTDARMHETIVEYGNTGAASVGITLDEAARAGEFDRGDLVLLAGFGGGMAAGLALLRW
ncbi:3-oxoacyl-ACP synthase III family protein [Mobilicoccus massiliensis]|uniref:3-oxoacyl-ACP synthase III family protein n=1 Tax=Mobilicoccus massiliensis TaxID=1522310 RepID=UPI000590BC99|nr:3-oxoacyl-[acyl-carrier-protein] synthase III C-terminal domain-containing protein [Mobilicoccus massiliensis]